MRYILGLSFQENLIARIVDLVNVAIDKYDLNKNLSQNWKVRRQTQQAMGTKTRAYVKKTACICIPVRLHEK
mgnify:CR=1 FL=1